MTDEQRSALAAYFALYKGQEEGMAKMFLSATDHPFVASAYALLDAAWHEARLSGPAPGAQNLSKHIYTSTVRTWQRRTRLPGRYAQHHGGADT